MNAEEFLSIANEYWRQVNIASTRGEEQAARTLGRLAVYYENEAVTAAAKEAK